MFSPLAIHWPVKWAGFRGANGALELCAAFAYGNACTEFEVVVMSDCLSLRQGLQRGHFDIHMMVHGQRERTIKRNTRIHKTANRFHFGHITDARQHNLPTRLKRERD